ncbi:GNAT family N-acetyltransferase [Nonomuraea glycinis]|uniref:N-acetyltransferase domain-containing protein n=1 Tax=Nonomuraea glycinis TaxID=2047744 RepID=A0A918ADM6_9ACTN|nr:GNAT family N-acetyltransferase [Nonomuraea glycinis]MCA2179698.1 GNAT family N-acetyltransferase [Nonomuraea glycinis]GGP16417.1 hypothetical protein GCM10012278_80040 [Nonomuraea glycinis]
MTLPSSAVRLTGHDLVLREWEEADLPVMAELFDDPGVAYRTPLASPFGLDEARAYLEMVRRTRAAGDRLHLAITTDGHKPLGEVLVSLSRASMGYAIGAAHRGQRLAPRATRLLMDYAHEVLEIPRLVLEIEPDNAPSVSVARALGFRLTDEEPAQVEEKGRVLTLRTWAHDR